MLSHVDSGRIRDALGVSLPPVLDRMLGQGLFDSAPRPRFLQVNVRYVCGVECLDEAGMIDRTRELRNSPVEDIARRSAGAVAFAVTPGGEPFVTDCSADAGSVTLIRPYEGEVEFIAPSFEEFVFGELLDVVTLVADEDAEDPVRLRQNLLEALAVHADFLTPDHQATLDEVFRRQPRLWDSPYGWPVLGLLSESEARTLSGRAQ